MRNIVFGLICLIMCTLQSKAQENCSTYYPLVEGTSYQYGLFNKKGKSEGTSAYEISEVTTENGNTVATMRIKFTDAKGKNPFESDYKITCTSEGIKIDFKSLFPSQMEQQYEEMGLEMDITGTDVEIPNELRVGQTLADANITVNMSMSGMNMKFEVNTTDRTVLERETITTNAGTFDCYVISAKTKSKVMMTNQEMNDKVWLAEGVGIIKQESYNRNGKLISSMVLSDYSG